MRVLDTHVHLDSEDYAADLPQVLDRAEEAGVVASLAPATDLASARRILEIARDPRVRAAVGIHPHQASSFHPGAPAEIRELATTAVALGETGLDYHYDFAPREAQIANLRAHLELALELDLPVILHCREAEEDLHRELRRTRPRGVVHCFTAGWEWAERFLELGLYVGVTGMVTFPKLAMVHEVAERCPADRLLVETDGPYLAPIPFRGKRNEPAHVVRVVHEIARRRNQDPEEVARASVEAAVHLFRLQL